MSTLEWLKWLRNWADICTYNKHWLMSTYLVRCPGDLAGNLIRPVWEGPTDQKISRSPKLCISQLYWTLLGKDGIVHDTTGTPRQVDELKCIVGPGHSITCTTTFDSLKVLAGWEYRRVVEGKIHQYVIDLQSQWAVQRFNCKHSC